MLSIFQVIFINIMRVIYERCVNTVRLSNGVSIYTLSPCLNMVTKYFFEQNNNHKQLNFTWRQKHEKRIIYATFDYYFSSAFSFLTKSFFIELVLWDICFQEYRQAENKWQKCKVWILQKQFLAYLHILKRKQNASNNISIEILFLFLRWWTNRHKNMIISWYIVW